MPKNQVDSLWEKLHSKRMEEGKYVRKESPKAIWGQKHSVRSWQYVQLIDMTVEN
jgi:hypothetical protein